MLSIYMTVFALIMLSGLFLTACNSMEGLNGDTDSVEDGAARK